MILYLTYISKYKCASIVKTYFLETLDDLHKLYMTFMYVVNDILLFHFLVILRSYYYVSCLFSNLVLCQHTVEKLTGVNIYKAMEGCWNISNEPNCVNLLIRQSRKSKSRPRILLSVFRIIWTVYKDTDIYWKMTPHFRKDDRCRYWSNLYYNKSPTYDL